MQLKDFSNLKLKPDHEDRSIWVCGHGPARVFLDTSSSFYQQSYDFLIAIAEPLARPEHIHEYGITDFSLYAAASIGLQTNDIISGLDRISKVYLSARLKDYIRDHTAKCGKVKFVLHQGRYWLESADPRHLVALLGKPSIAAARIIPSAEDRKEFEIYESSRGPLIMRKNRQDQDSISFGKQKANQNLAMGLSEDDVSKDAAKVLYFFEVRQKDIESVRSTCVDAGFPTLEEYDFRHDKTTPELPISLKAATQIRPYQEKSLSKMFGNTRARSGLIVLPCGAGKTLVGVTAAATIKKSTIVFATTGVSCGQWKQQFKLWSTIPRENIVQFTSSVKNRLTDKSGPVVLITTYNMVAIEGKRSAQTQKIMEQIKKREWGLIIFDEVHVAPASRFRKCASTVKSRCKLGLTATLVREDGLISDLNFLIGPKLYEANWLSLQEDGYIATVECLEIWCPMSPLFFKAYLEEDKNTSKRSKLLYIMNPNKFRTCEYLIRMHEQKGDKILVFSDNIYGIEKYAKALDKYFIHGKTGDNERKEVLAALQEFDDVNTVFISKVGDCSIDLPDVNVIIQISSHYGSRRQEAQRLGRILRPKSRTGGKAYFYTLVSRDTREMVYSTKRQRFLVDQGYSFHVIPEIITLDEEGFMYKSEKDRKDLLLEVLAADEEAAEDEETDEEYDVNNPRKSGEKNDGKKRKGPAKGKRNGKKSKTRGAVRTKGSMSRMSTDKSGYGEKRKKVNEKRKREKEKRRKWNEEQRKDIRGD